MARRLRGAVDARQVPLPGLSASRDPRLGCGRRQLRSGAAAGRLRAVGARRHERGRGRARRRRQRLARRFGRRAARGAFPTCAWSTSPGNVGYARAANLGIAATRAPVVAVLQPRSRRWSPAPRRRCSRALRRTSRALGAVRPADPQPRRLRLPVGAALAVGRRSRSAHGLLGLWWPTQPVHRALPRSSTPIPRSRASVDWVSGAAVWLRRERARRGRRMGRALLHVHGGRRPLLAAAARRAATSRTSPAGAVVHVQGASTSRTPVPDARRAPPLGVAVRPPAAHRARARVLLPFAARLSGLSRACLAMAEHAWRASRPAPRPRLACPS